MTKKENEEKGEGSIKEPEPVGNTLPMFMLRFVLGSGLLEYDTWFQERHKQSRAKPEGGEKPVGAWSHFLIGDKLHDPRLTLHIAAFGGLEWDKVNKYESQIELSICTLRWWERWNLPRMPEMVKAFRRFKESPGETFLQLEKALGKGVTDQNPTMKFIEDRIQSSLRHCSQSRPKFNIWDCAIDHHQVRLPPEHYRRFDYEANQVNTTVSRSMLHENPWLDVRKIPGRVLETREADEEFLVNRFQLWDAKLRFAEELKELTPTAAKKQLEAHDLLYASPSVEEEQKKKQATRKKTTRKKKTTTTIATKEAREERPAVEIVVVSDSDTDTESSVDGLDLEPVIKDKSSDDTDV